MLLSRDELSRRAFAPDTRAVWVESQLVGETLVPRDNLPLGPGEYHIDKIGRHISTPKLGNISRVTPFLQFRSAVERKPVEIPYDKTIMSCSTLSNSPSQARRQDGNVNSGPYVSHVSILGPFQTVHGVSKSMNIAFSPTKHDCCPTKHAVNSPRERSDYRLPPKLVTLPRADRFQYRKTEYEVERECRVDKGLKSSARGRRRNSHNGEMSQVILDGLGSVNLGSVNTYTGNEQDSMMNGNPLDSSGNDVTDMCTGNAGYREKKQLNRYSGSIDIINISCSKKQYQFVSSPKKMLPRKKFRKPVSNEAMIRASFDTSSYDRMRKSKPKDLNPIIIDRLSRIKLFDKTFVFPSQHRSNPLKASTEVYN